MVRRSSALVVVLALAACKPKEPETPEQPPPPAQPAPPAPAPAPAPVPVPAPAPGSLRLPVVGEWRVYRTHYFHRRDQSSAVDLVVNGPMPSPASANKDYPSYGRPVVADGAGVVVIVVDGVPDNDLGTSNIYDMHGNYVVIDHGGGIFSLFAHLILGTMKVRVGERVVAGQVIGACGNSGRSSMPHLHWQVMDQARAHMANGVPIPLAPYQRNGATSTDRLERGDVIRALE